MRGGTCKREGAQLGKMQVREPRRQETQIGARGARPRREVVHVPKGYLGLAIAGSSQWSLIQLQVLLRAASSRGGPSRAPSAALSTAPSRTLYAATPNSCGQNLALTVASHKAIRLRAWWKRITPPPKIAYPSGISLIPYRISHIP